MRLPFARRPPGSADDLADAAADALDAGDPRGALRLADDALTAARRAGGEPDLLAAAQALRAAALNDLDRFTDALRAADAAVSHDAAEAAAWSERASALYRLGRFEDAAESLERLLSIEGDDAEAWHRLGRVRTWLGDARGARTAFRRAAELDPEAFRIPVRIASVEFDRIAAEAWRSIPAPFRARLHNATVTVEELPGRDEVEDGTDPDLLGVYEGGTALEDDLPERIVLYQRNHEAVCATLGELHEEIRRTMLHEVGHHFGMEEEELPW